LIVLGRIQILFSAKFINNLPDNIIIESQNRCEAGNTGTRYENTGVSSFLFTDCLLLWFFVLSVPVTVKEGIKNPTFRANDPNWCKLSTMQKFLHKENSRASEG
jgi:hypothetical protein